MINFKKLFSSKPAPSEGWSTKSSFTTISTIDYSVIITVLALLILGFVMVYSASISLGDSPKYQTSESYFAVRHGIYILIGLVAGFLVFKMPLHRWYVLSYPLGLLGILLLIAVFIPGLGHEVNGSIRWIGMGPVNLQVSEVVKFVSVLVISHFVVTRQAYMHSYTRGLVPVMLYIGAVAMLLSLQPDLGATVVISAIVLGVVFLGGLSWRIIVPFGVVILAVIVLSIIIYRPFCKYICPLGAFYGLFNKFSFYQMEVDTKKCTGCKACERQCKMNVEILKNINSAECIRCGECKDACAFDAIKSGYKAFGKEKK